MPRSPRPSPQPTIIDQDPSRSGGAWSSRVRLQSWETFTESARRSASDSSARAEVDKLKEEQPTGRIGEVPVGQVPGSVE